MFEVLSKKFEEKLDWFKMQIFPIALPMARTSLICRSYKTQQLDKK